MRARLYHQQHQLDEGAWLKARHRRGLASHAQLGARVGGACGNRAIMSPIDANTPDFETPQHEDGRRRSEPATIIPRDNGQRASACASSTRANGRAPTPTPRPAALCSASLGRARFLIYDQKGLEVPGAHPHHKATFVEADTTEELAAKARPRTGHARSYGTGIQPRHHGHRAVRSDPPGQQGHQRYRRSKSNWAIRASTGAALPGPFRSPVALSPSRSAAWTWTNAQVISTIDQPIKGLFASGDISGLFFHNYPSFTGQTRNAVLDDWPAAPRWRKIEVVVPSKAGTHTPCFFDRPGVMGPRLRGDDSCVTLRHAAGARDQLGRGGALPAIAACSASPSSGSKLELELLRTSSSSAGSRIAAVNAVRSACTRLGRDVGRRHHRAADRRRRGEQREQARSSSVLAEIDHARHLRELGCLSRLPVCSSRLICLSRSSCSPSTLSTGQGWLSASTSPRIIASRLSFVPL